MASHYEDVAMALSPSSYWRFSEAAGDIIDQVAAADLVVQTPVGSSPTRAYSTGLAGAPLGYRCGPYGGGSNYGSSFLSAAAPPQPVTDQVSIAGWFRRLGAVNPSNGGWLVNFANVAGYVDPYHALAWQFFSSGASTMISVGTNLAFSFDATADAIPAIDGWHHIALTYDGVNKKLWVDGVVLISQAWTGNMIDTAGIGFMNSYQFPADDRSFDTALAEWGWWNDHALTGPEILSLYNARYTGYGAEVITDAPVTWLRMDELATGVALADSSGNSHPFAEQDTGGTRAFGIPTPVGSAIQWTTGGSSYARFSPNRDTDLFSLEVVVKPPDNTGNYTVWGDTDGTGGNGWTLLVHNGKMAVIWNGGGFHDLTDAAFNDANFHHFVLTYDGTTVLGYLDGVLQTASYTPGAAPTPSAGQNVVVAKIQGTSTFQSEATVAYGDIAYYHSVLSAGRVTAHYAAFSGSVAQNLNVPFISSGTTLYTPVLTTDEADLPFIPPSTSLFPIVLTGSQDATLGFIPSSTVLLGITLTEPQNATLPFISPATTLYTMVMHHPPPVLTNVIPAGGVVGQTIDLVGLNFTDASNVSFDGHSALFTVLSDTHATTIVPVGATTGLVTITTPEGTDSSPYIFTVQLPVPVDPTAFRFRQYHQWRFLFADLDCVTITSPNDLITGRRISKVLNAATVIEASIFPDDFRVNGIADDGYPRIAQSNRIVFCFRREGGSPPWKCRAAGILMSPQDEGDADVPVTHFSAYDPWKLLEARPVVNANGELPDGDGFNYLARRGNEIVLDILLNAITGPDGGVFIDAGLSYGGTQYWNGTIENTPVITFGIQQGTFIADAWGQLCEAGNLDIVLRPIYDPIRRPGFTHDLSVVNLAGVDKNDAIFAWDRLSRNLAKIDRMHDGTPGSFFNKVQYYAGQGGPPVPATGPLVNAASVAAFTSYWSQQFFPNQTSVDPTGSAVFALAEMALELAKQGRRTLTLFPIPERAPIPLVDYDLGDRVPVYASNALRVTADGFQRIEGIPIEISDDAIETVSALLTTPDFRTDPIS